MLQRRVFQGLRRVLPAGLSESIRRWRTAVLTPLRFSVRTGHWRSSIRGAAVSRNGDPLPWFTFAAIDFLAQRDFRGKNILEFGGGQSTSWWASRSQGVWTIEEDMEWSRKIQSRELKNVTVMHSPVDPATRSVSAVEQLLDDQRVDKFDVVIIDGHLRRELVAVAFRRLAKDGCILLDNAEGYEFFEELQKFSCSKIDFFGFAPGVSLRHCTSMVFVDSCFLLRRDIPIPDLEKS